MPHSLVQRSGSEAHKAGSFKGLALRMCAHQKQTKHLSLSLSAKSLAFRPYTPSLPTPLRFVVYTTVYLFFVASAKNRHAVCDDLGRRSQSCRGRKVLIVFRRRGERGAVDQGRH